MNRLCIVFLMFALVLPLAAQRGSAPAPTLPGQQTPRPERDQTISINVDLVDLLVSVADKKGKFITSLKKDDFKIFEDDRIQSITNFSSETDLPLTIALLVDTSGSIRDKLRFEQEAAIEFFYSTLRRGKDKALVISFDSGVDLLQDFTDDPEKLSDAVRKIRAGGGTSLYDAIYLAVNEKLANQGGRRVLILISDGDDNSSRTSLTETLEVAQKNFVTIYGISTNSAAYFGSKEQDRGDKTLRKFSEETGGKPFFPFKVQDLAISFQDISEELRSQYRIAYRSSNGRADGTFRKVRVDVSDKRFKAKTRNGYYAPRATAQKN
ncbi:MAG TPA: VWA domain-containing protein [Terriglobia bacterium]|nr:VWA domain-containing protein [Terriglobia bacterium]